MLYPDRVSSGPYLDSAHGNYTGSSPYGVLRTSLSNPPNNYGQGNCTHCHEQHTSIGGSEPAPSGPSSSSESYELFQKLFTDQGSTFCYGCHKDPGVSQQFSMPNQHNYSYIAGGDNTNTCPNYVKEAFKFVDTMGSPQLNCGSSAGSSHFLADIRTFLTTTSGWHFGGTTESINPCSGCHNPHRAKRDPHTPAERTSGGNLVISSVSRPSQHNKDNNAWQLWGDENGERMSDYALSAGAPYQAPCRYPWSTICTSYEPDGSNVTNGSNLFDSVTFCLDCHQYQITTTKLHNSHYYVIAINWGVNGDIHGTGTQDGSCKCDLGDKKPPYPDDYSVSYEYPNPYIPYPNYVLSCLDCHEPHGSPNEFLLREEVNGIHVGVLLSSPVAGGYWYKFCVACHKNISDYPNPGDPGKHRVDSPFRQSSACAAMVCHGHGTQMTNPTFWRCRQSDGYTECTDFMTTKTF